MSTWRPNRCKRCGTTRDDGADIGKLGYCKPCGVARVAEAITSMATRSGPEYERHTATRPRMTGRPKAKGVGGSRASADATTDTEKD